MNTSYVTPSEPVCTVEFPGVRIEKRRNLAPNPRVSRSGTEYEAVSGGLGGEVASGISSGGPAEFPLYAIVRRTVEPTSGNSWMRLRQRGIPVVAGETYTLSAWVNTTGTVLEQLLLTFRSASGANLGQINGGEDSRSGEWKRLSLTGKAPLGTVSVDIAGGLVRTDVDDVFRMTGVLLEKSVTMGEFFDGDTAPAGDVRTRWLGEPGASASVWEARYADVIGGQVTMDETYSPLIRASVVVPADQQLAEYVDPRAGKRMTLTVHDASNPLLDPRVFDLGVRDRTVDHVAHTMTFEATSDEMLLHDTGRLASTTDRSAREHETSLRGVVGWALSKVGATLQPAAPGDPDPDMTASWDQTNLAPNPRALHNLDGWIPAGADLTRRTSTDVIEGASIQSYILATVDSSFAPVRGAMFDPSEAQPIRITEGRLYTLSAWVRHNGTVVEGYVSLTFRDDAGTYLSERLGSVQNIPPNVWTKVTVTATAPVNAASAAIMVAGVGSSLLSGRQFRITGVVLAEGVVNNRWFDGDRPDEAAYAYEWAPTPGASPSTRVALHPLDSDLYAWEPGQSLFDFLRPFLEVSNTRLYCDEQRRWWLKNVDETSPGASVVVAATTETSIGNAVAAIDVISRDRDDWATGVVVAYTWRTANGDRKTQYDSAGTAGKVIRIDRDAAWPGPGAAAVILESMSKRGRTQGATIVRGFDASAGFGSIVTLPGTAEQVGRVRRVVLDLATGNADINTIGSETA